MRSRGTVCLALLILALTTASVAGPVSGTFYGVRGSFGVGEPADLITIDPTTGSLLNVVGLTGLTGLGGFAISPLDGTLYVMGGGDGTPGLHMLDPLTGAATSVGGGATASDMAFDSAGTLYAIMAKDGIGIWGELATVDLATGAITSIGGSFFGGIGVAFDSSGTLYVKARNPDQTTDLLHTVDPLTGDILSTVTLDQQLFNSLAIDVNDVLYSHDIDWDTNTSYIHTIDPTTGATIALPGAIPFLDRWSLISALDFQPVPEPTSLLLLGLGGLMVAGMVHRKRRTRA